MTQYGEIDSQPSMSDRELSVTSQTVIVQVLEVHSPNLIVPGITKDPWKSKISLRDFGQPPFFVRLPCRMLRQHSSGEAPSCSESSIEHRSNSIHGSTVTKPFNFNLIDDDMSEVDELLDAINEELGNNNIVVLTQRKMKKA